MVLEPDLVSTVDALEGYGYPRWSACLYTSLYSIYGSMAVLEMYHPPLIRAKITAAADTLSVYYAPLRRASGSCIAISSGRKATPASPSAPTASCQELPPGPPPTHKQPSDLSPASVGDRLKVVKAAGIDVPPSRSGMADFLNSHLANTRPNNILFKFKNGRVRTYEPVFETRKIVVAARQMQQRRAYAPAAVAGIFGLEPEMITTAMSDICRRAMHCGGVAVAPAAALSALPVRLQIHFMIDNNVSGALFQRARLLLGPAACLDSRERLRADQNLVAAEPQNAAGVNDGASHLMSPRAALQAMFNHAGATDQFLKRLLRGADGRQIEANETFDGQDSAAALPLSGVRDVQICFGLNKVGLHSTCKAVLSNCNQAHPSSRGNTFLYGVFPASKDDYEALTAMAAVYTLGLDGLRQGGLLLGGLRRAVRLILTGALRFISTWLWHTGHSSTHPCVWCTVVLRRTRTNGSRVDQLGDMQAGSQARGMLRTLSDYEEAVAQHAGGGNATLDTPHSADAHLCIVKRPFLLVDPTHILPAPLHRTLGTALYLLRLAI